MKLKNYRFGHVENEQRQFDTDIIVFGDWIHDWWRNRGHRVIPQDLEPLMSRNPGTIVFGKGASGRMTLTPDVKRFLEEQNIDYEAMTTDRAIQRFNELEEQGTRVAGAFHLTC